MIELNSEEIKFVKEVHFTPTVYQLNEYSRTPFKDYEDCKKVANKLYHFDLDDFIKKNLNQKDTDEISLEYTATYLFYTFFTEDELEELSEDDALKWLEDYRYYRGFRKFDPDQVLTSIDEALEVYYGVREFYISDDNQIWNREIDSIESEEITNG